MSTELSEIDRNQIEHCACREFEDGADADAVDWIIRRLVERKAEIIVLALDR